MDTVETLLAVEEIRKVKARRCRCVDEKDWAGYVDCHTPDAISYALSSPTVGAQAMADLCRKQVEGKTTVHHVHAPEIEILSETTAKGSWAMEDMLWWQEGGREHWTHGYGRYDETYEKQGGRWLIASRRLSRIRVDHGVVGDAAKTTAAAG